VADVPESEWLDLVDEIVRAQAPRTLISSEGLSTAGAQVVRRIVADLGADRVHVVRVERRLDRLLPSAWQERVKSSNESRTYPAFLDDVLSVDPATAEGSRASFWAAHSLEKYLDRWRTALPDDRIHVVVAEEGDPRGTADVFERMLGLPTGMLDPTQLPNSSLSWERTELCRRLNEVFDEHGWPDGMRRRLLQNAVVKAMRETPNADHDSRIPPVTGEHLRRTAALSDARIALLTNSGVDVIGDPEPTRVRTDAGLQAGDPEQPTTIAIGPVVAAIEELMARAQPGTRRSRAGATP